MGNIFTSKIAIAILVVLVAIAGSLAWMVKDRQVHNAREDAEYEQHLVYRARMTRKTVEEVRAEEANLGTKNSFPGMPSGK